MWLVLQTRYYSPYLSQCVFFRSQDWKITQEHRFGTLESSQTAVTVQQKAIPVSDYQHRYEECMSPALCDFPTRHLEGNNVNFLCFFISKNYKNQSHYLSRQITNFTVQLPIFRKQNVVQWVNGMRQTEYLHLFEMI